MYTFRYDVCQGLRMLWNFYNPSLSLSEWYIQASVSTSPSMKARKPPSDPIFKVLPMPQCMIMIFDDCLFVGCSNLKTGKARYR